MTTAAPPVVQNGQVLVKQFDTVINSLQPAILAVGTGAK
jgi:hypothetical protein